jgi:hypothetical protein
METTSLRPYLNIIVALVVTAFLLAFTVDVSVSNVAGVKTELPDKVGEWKGDEIRFCQNPACLEEFYLSELVDRNVCPECGGELAGMSKVEADILPDDTIIVKKKYTHPDGQSVFVSLVMSGKERSSIHRPQLCLAGQGNEITQSKVFDVPMEGRDDLGVMMLDMTTTVPGGSDGKPMVFPRYYAYWFVGRDRETPYHLERMFWMAFDRVFRNVAHRWSYISVAGVRGSVNSEDRAHVEQAREFIYEFYPQISDLKS